MDNPRVVNLEQMPWRTLLRSDRITVDVKDPARRLGSTVSGFRIERVMPGKQASPPHRHHLQEELFLILAGVGVLRHAGREIPVGPGDFIVYPPGDPAAHTFVNHGSTPLEYIATGNRVPYEVCEYPEDGTVYVEALDRALRNEAVPSEHTAVEAGHAEAK
jgi:uncharacterized cupin superfamily protein